MCPNHKHPAIHPNCGQGPTQAPFTDWSSDEDCDTTKHGEREREQGTKKGMKKIGRGRDKEKRRRKYDYMYI